MDTPLILAALALAIALIALAIAVLGRAKPLDLSPLREDLSLVKAALERLDRHGVDAGQRQSDAFAKLAQAQAERLDQVRDGLAQSAKAQREELAHNLATTAKAIETRLDANKDSLEASAKALREELAKNLNQLRLENTEKLDAMRQTVDEKLQATLERRLGESFQLVSERLEKVHQGLGEMQNLAAGVGDLKRVLTNVKSRGTWGEVQLTNLLDSMLAPSQYALNIETRAGSGQRVEVAIRLPGRGPQDAEVLLPIDAKFPREDYERLIEAAERADAKAVEDAAKALEAQLKFEAKKIAEKYLNPPVTTDFALMFLPTEGLYAEALRRPGLADTLQRDHRVVIAGPTTLLAILNSLQMGFRTLAIERRSSEVWQVLAGVKLEFGKFEQALLAVRKKLSSASESMEKIDKRGKAMNKALRQVEILPETQALDLPFALTVEDEADEDLGDET